MSSGLYSGQPGLSLGTGLYRTVSGLWSGASGLAMAFGGAGMPLSLNFLTMTAYTLDPRITFSRGSQAMVTDATGKLTYAPNNLLTNSESFEAAAWAKTNATVTANTVAAPDGTTTADTLAATNANATALQTFTATGATYIYSVYIRRKTGTGNIDITVDGTTYATKSVTSSWVRYDTLLTPAAGSKTAGVRIATSGDEVYIWGAQLEAVTYQTTPSPYVSTTPKNLLGYTQEFDNAAWVKTAATITANNAVAPDGTLTADLITSTASTTSVGQTFTLSAAPYAISVFAKAGMGTWIRIGQSSSAVNAAYFDLSNGAVGTVIGAGNSASITSVGNGWYRCSLIVQSPVTTSANVFFAMSDVDNSTSVTAGKTVYIWGAQLSNSASVDPYVYNPVAAPSSTAYYGPRFDYDPVTLAPKGLLIEESRQNLCLYSQTPSDASWASTNAAKTSTNNTDPFGTNTALLLTSNGISGFHFIAPGSGTANISYTSGTTYTMSCWVKAGTTNLVQLTFPSAAFGAPQYANFSLTGSGSVTASTGGTATITKSSDGFYRMTWSATATVSIAAQAGVAVFITSGTDGRLPTNTSSDTLYVAGWQVEAGSFATSYIPTVASTVTRSADVALMQGANFSNWYNQSEGTFVVGASTLRPTTTSLVNFAAIASDATVNNRVQVAYDTANMVSGVIVSGSGQASFSASVSTGQISKAALAYKSNDFASSFNGSAASTDTSGSVPTVNRLSIGNNWDASNFFLNGYIRSISYYNTRLLNLQLQALTS